ncbi:MAG: tetratricopeptide repeat protein [Aggregatilineales bacterium]
MIQQLLPNLIHENFSQGIFYGSLDAVTLFIDISGFTPLTETLMQYRRDGAEALTQVLQSVFSPCVHHVYQQGGFISTYAGDAFTAIFPSENHADAPLRALATAFYIRQFFSENGEISTPYGAFQVSVKIGLGQGRVDWGVIGRENQHTYYFRGEGVKACAFAEHQADKGEIISNMDLLPSIASHVKSQPLTEDYVLLTGFSNDVPALLEPERPLNADDLRPFVPDAVIKLESRGEFRDVSVAFISIEDTEDSEDYTTINSFIADVLVLCNRYGGYFRHVDFGDKGAMIVLLFGAPVAYENNSERAADCLLAIRALQTTIRWRGGLTFGTTYAGFTGGEERSDYAAIGDIVNLSARLCMSAEWGEIWTTAQVQSWLRASGFQFDSLGTQSFKGKTQMVEVYALTGKRIASFVEAQSITMIGREQELTNLTDAVNPILNGHFGGITYIYGEAGIGKSQLVLALRQQMVTSQNVGWYYLPADEILSVSYNPFRHFLRQYFDQQVGSGININRNRFDAKIDALIQSPELVNEETIRATLDRTRSFIGALIDLRWNGSLYEQVEPTQRAENTQIALKNLFLAESLRQPLILHFEDIHWIDEDTRSIIVTLTRNMEGYPIVMLMTSRYNDDGSSVTIPDLDPETPLHTIALQPFDRENTARQVNALLGGDSDESFVTYLLDKTSGNPFFVEQLVYHLLELNLLEQHHEMWRVKESQLSEVPTTIGAVLVARLDRLTLDIKTIVQTAAVLGQEFEVNVLSSMLRNDPDVDNKVKAAEDQSIWTAITRILYLFKHALMRDAAYDMQLRSRLRELHALAATAIRDVYTDDLPSHYGDLAYHYGKAGDTENEREYSLLAGQSAAAGATADAANFLARAYELTPEHELQARYEILGTREKIYDMQGNREPQREVIEIMQKIADQLADDHKRASTLVLFAHLLETIGGFKQGHDVLDEAIVVAEKINARDVLAIAEKERASGYLRQGNLNEAMPHLSRATDIYQELGDVDAQCSTLNTMSVGYINTGNFDEGRRLLQRSQELAKDSSREHTRGKVFQNLAVIAQYTGHYAEAEAYLKQAYDIMLKYGDRRNQAACITNMGANAYSMGDYETAHKYFVQSQSYYREAGDLTHVVHTTQNLGAILIQRYEYEEAIRQLELGLKLGDQIGSVLGIGHMNDTLANLYILLGQYEKAQYYLEIALVKIRAIKDKRVEMYNLGAQSMLKILLGDYATALDFAKQNIEGSLSSHFRQLSTIGYRMRGRVLLEQGDIAGSREAYQKSLEIEIETEETHFLIENWAGLARAELADGNLDEALKYVEKCLANIAVAYDLAGMTEKSLIYLTCYDVLVAADDLQRAQEVLNTGHKLVQFVVGKLTNPDYIDSFLNNIVANKRLVQLWEAQNPA